MPVMIPVMIPVMMPVIIPVTTPVMYSCYDYLVTLILYAWITVT